LFSPYCVFFLLNASRVYCVGSKLREIIKNRIYKYELRNIPGSKSASIAGDDDTTTILLFGEIVDSAEEIANEALRESVEGLWTVEVHNAHTICRYKVTPLITMNGQDIRRCLFCLVVSNGFHVADPFFQLGRI